MSRWAIAATLSVVFLSTLACGAPRSPISTATPPAEISPTHTATPEATMPPVPAEYQILYDSLSEDLDRFQDTIDAQWDGQVAGTVFGAELIIANGNRGEALLLPETLQAVQVFLDRIKEIGVGGVTLQISDPLLSPDYPRSAEYLEFFRDVAQQVRARDLALMVEAGPVFADPQYSRVQYDWSGLTVDQFFQMRKEQLVMIAREVQPDYLSLGNEPSTQIMLTGIPFSRDQYLEFVRDTAASIDRSSGILLGAGTGSWEDPAYLDALSNEPLLDFINIHIYPLSSGHFDFIELALDAAATANARGMKVIIGETWLFKATPQEIDQRIAYQDVYARDVYSFWQPLDIRFFEAIMGMAHDHQFEYVSFFWAGLLFSYLDYYQTPQDLSAVDMYLRLNRSQFDNILAGVFSETGRAYQALLGGPSLP